MEVSEAVKLTAGQLLVLGSVIAGITELLTRLRAKDMWVVATIATAALVGGLVALYFKADFLDGVVAGFGASGALKALGSIGNKSTPAPSKVVQ